jgi:hypothetical protein
LAFADRVRRVWNAFTDPTGVNTTSYTGSSSSSYSSGSPSRTAPRSFNDRSILTSITNRIAIDVSDALLRHVVQDDQGRYLQDKDSLLNDCFSWEANLDQSPRAFRQDIAQTVLDHGVAAVVPVDTTNPVAMGDFDVFSVRVGTITQWHAEHVRG